MAISVNNLINIFHTDPSSEDVLSYSSILKDRTKFIAAGTRNGDDFNKFDTPNTLYFKIMFYFYNGDVDRPDNFLNSGGLLAPTWSKITGTDYYNYNSAWSYLMLNNENERADKLKKFVELLSNISSNAPWYFQSIEGLDAARTRNIPQSTELKIEEARQKISIKCLNDAYDNRIGTLLDLYRDIVWSHLMKREVIPANLRKFDMGIYIFSSPVSNMHNPIGMRAATINKNSSDYLTSYKYIELHNCEIDYNSGLSALGVLDNTIGTQPLYNIDIYFDDIYEESYNEFMMRYIGDIILYDTSALIESKAQEDDINHETELSKRADLYDMGGLLESAIGEVTGFAKDRINEFINSKLLGNIFTFSPIEAAQQVKDLMDGKVFNTINAAKDYLSTPNKKKTGNMGNIFSSKTIANNL